jgi:hypothetical protein
MTVKTYKNVLEAHTAFVLDRYNFLANIQAAVIKEGDADSKALFNTLREGNFVELIAGLMEDPDARNREQALFTIANLLALEGQEVLVQRTKKAVLERICTVSHNMYDPETGAIQKTAAYVYHNLAMLLENRRWKDLDKDEDGRITDFCNRVMDIFNGLYGSAPLLDEVRGKQARKDLLYSVQRVSGVRPLSASLGRLLSLMLGAPPVDMSPLMEILANRLQQDDSRVPPEFQDEVLDRLLLALVNDAYGRKTHLLALWSLSNFAVEAGVADKLALYDELLEAVLECAFLRTGLMRTNAIWVLGNMIVKVTTDEAKEALSRNCAIRTALVDAVNDADVLSDAKAVKAAVESLDHLDKWVEAYGDEDETTELEECPNVVEECPNITKEEMEAFMEAVRAQQAEVPIVTPPVFNTTDNTNYPTEVPITNTVANSNDGAISTALDLMLEGRAAPSAVVRMLVQHLRAAGYTNWVAIPAGTSLTVEDLMTLSLMGYVIQRGYLGVNPLLLSAL